MSTADERPVANPLMTPAEPGSSFTHADQLTEAARAEMEREVEFAATERMMFFSDAVVAIALTLLALELPLPKSSSVTSREILHDVGESFSEYLAFLISFFVIAFHWRLHHRLFRYVTQVTQRVLQLNVLWLLLVVLTPFFTKFLSTGKEIGLLRFGSYAGLEAIQYFVFSIMVVLIIRQDFLKQGTDLERLRTTLRNTIPVGGGFALSIPLYLVIGQFAFIAWGIVPFIIGWTNRFLRYRRLRAARNS